MILQLDPTIQVKVTSKNNREGRALAWLDYSTEADTLWLVAFYDTGECWWIPQSEIRLHENWSLGR